jgi:hypothetical protein
MTQKSKAALADIAVSSSHGVDVGECSKLDFLPEQN